MRSKKKAPKKTKQLPKEVAAPGRPRKVIKEKPAYSTFTTYVEDGEVLLAMNAYCDALSSISGSKYSRSRLVSDLVHKFFTKGGVLDEDGKLVSVDEIESKIKTGAIKAPTSDIKFRPHMKEESHEEKSNSRRQSVRTGRNARRPGVRKV